VSATYNSKDSREQRKKKNVERKSSATLNGERNSKNENDQLRILKLK